MNEWQDLTTGERLKILRVRKGLTQQQTADAIEGVTRVQYSYYENQARGMSLAFGVKFADFFGVSLDVLAGRAPEDEDSLTSYGEGWRQGYARAADQAILGAMRAVGREELPAPDPERKPGGGPRLPERLRSV